jgi:hypothetical protein
MCIIDDALEVSKKYPIFPTNGKKPAWSNAELGVERGQGGYKIATQDPDRVRELFSHSRATEIAVPMGKQSGLICIDVDAHKDSSLLEWASGLPDTLIHTTRSGGLHYIFEHPGDQYKFPSTLREGVDLKAGGNGYICFPPTAGYKVKRESPVRRFPLEELSKAMKAKGGTGNILAGYNDATDEELIDRIRTATELYPSLRSLSYRLPNRKIEGKSIDRDGMVTILNGVMQQSVAAHSGHVRHVDWLDRLESIEHLVDTGILKAKMLHSDADLEAISASMGGKPLTRPIGPQSETSIESVEARIAVLEEEDGFEDLGLVNVMKEVVSPIEWVIPDMIPIGGITSVAGASNVGKTRWLAGLVAGLSVGDVSRMGLPAVDGPVASLWIANEERVDDIKRRIKASYLQHSDRGSSASIFVRGKDKGMLRLVGVNEIGNPEIDEDNIAIIVNAARKCEAKIIFLDPYITLSDAMDENSAGSAAIVTKALLMIATMSGAAVMYAHHTPKDRSKDNDWYRGDDGAWRGSGGIYSGLDCGFTLSNWLPNNPEQRRQWKAGNLTHGYSRWVVLDTGKIREGDRLPPVVYELVGQEMQEGEGRPIGVCAVRTESDALDVLGNTSIEAIQASVMAIEMVKRLGGGEFTNMSEVHSKMEEVANWPDVRQVRGKEQLHVLFKHKIPAENGGSVQLHFNEYNKTNKRWILEVKEG